MSWGSTFCIHLQAIYCMSGVSCQKKVYNSHWIVLIGVVTNVVTVVFTIRISNIISLKSQYNYWWRLSKHYFLQIKCTYFLTLSLYLILSYVIPAMSMKSLVWKNGIVADKQRCQALLIETSRSQEEKQKAREREREKEVAGAVQQPRLSRVWLCSSLTVFFCACVRACECVSEWEVFKASLPVGKSCKVTPLSASRQSLCGCFPLPSVACPSFPECNFLTCNMSFLSPQHLLLPRSYIL